MVNQNTFRAMAPSIVALAVTAGAAQVRASVVDAAPAAGHLFTIDASVAPTKPETGYFRMGSEAAAKSPAGHVISINSRYLGLDGQPWFPVMGEFHFSRYPAELWEDELLKMKAGGVQIVSTYVFWIHHEEVEGQFDWSGRRDLHRFIALCAKHGLKVWLRLGPWAHGEARNGGLPDWLLAKGPTRVNDPGYLAHARQLYDEIGRQAHGLLWKDGGPIIGVQLENEYTDRSPNAGAAHITTLKGLALAAGLDVPLYTVTGWDNAIYPPRIVATVFGGYSDEPWAGGRSELPPDTQGVYQFAPIGGNAGILQGVTSSASEIERWHYPRFTAELGAGLELTYHRRVVVDPEDIPPLAISALGSGVSMLGYYMYHGGANPDGKLGTLQESQATGYPNDVPVKSYDFQAPLGEFGQVNGSFRKLKVIHQFVADFGSELAAMPRVLPDIVPSGMNDTTTLRVAARAGGDRAFVFFNNHIPRYPMPDQKGVQVVLKLPAGSLTLPRTPVEIPSQASFFWPVNLDLDGAVLTYATAQPFAKLSAADGTYFFFMPTAGVAPEFVFATESIAAIDAKSGRISREGDRTYVTGTEPSESEAISIHTKAGRSVRIVLLSSPQAENAWKIKWAGHETMLLTTADVFSDDNVIHLRSRDASAFEFSVLPDFGATCVASTSLSKAGKSGLFTSYRASVETKHISVGIEKVREAEPVAPVKMGPYFAWRKGSVAQAPDDAAFDRAGAWQLTVPANALEGVRDVVLSVRYVGDVGRLYAGDHLVDDNFFNGSRWEIGLRELAVSGPAEKLRVEILPLRKDAPIYLPKDRWPDFGARTEVVGLTSVQAIPEYEVILRARP